MPDANDVPFAEMLIAATVHDSTVFEELVASVAPVKCKRGRHRKRPYKLHADKGYGYPRGRRFLGKRGVIR